MSLQASDLTNIFRKFPIPVSCLSIIFTGLVAMYFRSGKLAESAALLEQRTKDIKRLRANISASAQIDEQLLTLQKADQQFRGSAILVSELAKNPQIFYTLEKELGFSLPDVRQLVTVAPPKLAADEYFIIPFSIVAEGEFKVIMNFLKHLEFGQQANRITAASLSPTQGQRVSLNFTIEYLGLK